MPAADAAPSEEIHFPWCRKKHCKSNTQREPGTGFWLICHSLLNLPEIYCQLDSISLCLLIWLKGWFIKAQHHTECCSLLRRVMSCRHISFPFPMWLWGCWRRWEPAGFGVTHRQFCCEGLLLLAPGPACSPRFPQDRMCCVCQEVAGSCTKTSKAQRWQRGSGMGNDSRNDNDSGNKRIRNTRKWKDSLLLSLLLSLLSLGTMAWCCWTLLWLTTQSHHSTVGTNTFSLSGYLFWLWGVFLKQRWYLFQSQQNPSSHLNLQSHN